MRRGGWKGALLQAAVIASVAGGMVGGALTAPVVGGERPSPEKLRADAQVFRKALDLGRKASKSKNFADAVRHLTQAIVIDPNHPGALGELGWAAFQSGDHGLAARATQRAIEASKDSKQLGALYYNLGRIAEGGKEPWVAADHYRRSLALRPNDVVAKRLAQVGGDVPSSARVAKPERLCARAFAVHGCEGGAECTCKVSTKVETEEAELGGIPFTSAEGHMNVLEGVILRAAVVTASGQADGEFRDEILAVETGTGGWQWVDLAASEWNPGMFYVYNTGEVLSLDTFELSGSADRHGGHAVILRSKQRDRDGDYGENTAEIDNSDHVWVCAGDSAGVSCAHFVSASESGVEPMLDGEPVGEESRGSIGTREWAVDVEVEHGKVVVKRRSGSLPKHVEALLGAHDWPSLKRNPGVSMVPLR